MKPGEEKCSICNHILNRQKNGCTCVGCYCPTCNDAGTGEGLVLKEMYDTVLEDLEDACIERDALRSQLGERTREHSSLQKSYADVWERAETNAIAFGEEHDALIVTERDLASAQARIKELEGWKKSMIAVIPDWQKIGELIGVRLGDSVHDKVLPYIQTAQARIALATTFLRRADATSTQNELYDLLDEALAALAEPQSGEK